MLFLYVTMLFVDSEQKRQKINKTYYKHIQSYCLFKTNFGTFENEQNQALFEIN
jgi:hypothetical protein